MQDIETVRRHFGLERVSVMGYSYLGKVAVMYAMAHPERVDRIVQLGVRVEGFRQTFRRARVAPLTDHPLRIPLSSKLLLSEITQDLAAAALEVEGAYGSLYLGDDRAPDAAEWPLAYMNSYGITIAAGTSEIQRNILGERVLGLAKTK